MQILDILGPEDIVFGIQSSDIGAVASELLQRTLPRRGYSQSEIARLIGALLERELESPTLCGPIAIPHARDPQLQSFVAAIAINPNGIVAASPAPRILIAFASPESRRDEHLALLSTLARLSRDHAAVEAIAAASDATDVMTAIRAHHQ